MEKSVKQNTSTPVDADYSLEAVPDSHSCGRGLFAGGRARFSTQRLLADVLRYAGVYVFFCQYERRRQIG